MFEKWQENPQRVIGIVVLMIRVIKYWLAYGKGSTYIVKSMYRRRMCYPFGYPHSPYNLYKLVKQFLIKSASRKAWFPSSLLLITEDEVNNAEVEEVISQTETIPEAIRTEIDTLNVRLMTKRAGARNAATQQ